MKLAEADVNQEIKPKIPLGSTSLSDDNKSEDILGIFDKKANPYPPLYKPESTTIISRGPTRAVRQKGGLNKEDVAKWLILGPLIGTAYALDGAAKVYRFAKGIVRDPQKNNEKT